MMINKYYCLFLLCTITAFSQNLQSTLQTVFDANDLMGMSVYVFNPNTDEVYNFGFKNYSQNLPVDNDTKYRIASTVAFTVFFSLFRSTRCRLPRLTIITPFPGNVFCIFSNKNPRNDNSMRFSIEILLVPIKIAGS